jgi:hypothetical protein
MYSATYYCQILMKLELFRKIFKKNNQISNLMKICPVGNELFQADGRTDTTKVTVAFRNFSTALKERYSASPSDNQLTEQPRTYKRIQRQQLTCNRRGQQAAALSACQSSELSFSLCVQRPADGKLTF